MYNNKITLPSLIESIIEKSGSNILILDSKLNILNLNKSFKSLFMDTYGIELKKGLSLFEQLSEVNEELSESWKANSIKCKSGGTLKIEETFFLRGRPYYWEIYFNSIRLQNSMEIVSIFCKNITRQKSIRKKVIKNEANLRTILNSLDSSVILIDRNLRIIDFNTNALSNFIVAYGTKLKKNQNFLNFLLPHLVDSWKERIEKGLSNSNDSCMFLDNHIICDQDVICETKMIQIKEKEEVIGLTIYTEDVTEKKKYESRLNDQFKELVKINNELDQFVYIASHDLRAPLLSIKGLVDLLRESPKDNFLHYKNHLNHIEMSINKLDVFVTNITNYSKVNRLELKPEHIDFRHIIKESIESLSYLEGSKLIKCIDQYNESSAFYSDKIKLSIIIKNILSNAFQYYNINKKSSYVIVEVHTDNGKACITFEDNGIGIYDELQSKVFDMFFRASEISKGSGIGLYIVKNAIEKLGGKIRLESTVGVGTTFYIEIPNLINYQN